ncbi:hypothetical protein D7S86_19940 [Pararobbsia silviterrae]|uniref:Uncharacterized protein n=1 Tax=Pararobbsia silviterrae TaxID=1792498 RepID=A0A494XNB6_9BURK|nr:hypothetical protein D7S86_19940 [Pararobbsia silviterrae]
MHNGVRFWIEVYPKDGGTFAWAFSIEGAAFVGPEHMRASGRSAALAAAQKQAEFVIDGGSLKSTISHFKRRAADIDIGAPCCDWCQLYRTKLAIATLVGRAQAIDTSMLSDS